jgi:hypothetical protein
MPPTTSSTTERTCETCRFTSSAPTRQNQLHEGLLGSKAIPFLGKLADAFSKGNHPDQLSCRCRE